MTDEDTELLAAKGALKEALLSGDAIAVRKAEAEIVRLLDLRPPEFRVERA